MNIRYMQYEQGKSLPLRYKVLGYLLSDNFQTDALIVLVGLILAAAVIVRLGR